MTTHRTLIAGLILGSALAVGCEEQPDTTTTPRSPRTDTTTRTPSTPTPRDTDARTGTGSMQNVQARAQTLIDQINQHIKNGDYQAAETAIRELESIRSQLPQHMQTQVTTLRTSLNTAKQGDDTTTSPPNGSTPPSNPPATEP